MTLNIERCKKKFKGIYSELCKPIVVSPEPPKTSTILTSDTMEEVIEAWKQWHEEYLKTICVKTSEKLILLCDYYGLKKNDWFTLSLCMARDFVPGFNISEKKKVGRTKEWNMIELAIFNWKINKIHKEKSLNNSKYSFTSACKDYAKLIYKSDKTVINMYTASKSSELVKMFASIRKSSKVDSETLDSIIDEFMSNLEDEPTLKDPQMKKILQRL
jgi:hypothetical protein